MQDGDGTTLNYEALTTALLVITCTSFQDFLLNLLEEATDLLAGASTVPMPYQFLVYPAALGVPPLLRHFCRFAAC